MNSESDKPVEPPHLSRRRFTRAGLSGSVVLGSLASKPVLGASTYHCTVSGQVSGNLSRPGTAEACVLGDPPSTWTTANWPTPSGTTPSPLVKGTLSNPNNCNFNANQRRTKGTLFNGFVAGVGIPPLSTAFFLEQGQSDCRVIVGTTGNPASMLQVLSNTGTDRRLVLGRVVVASLLNCYQYPARYPVTARKVVAMFNGTFPNGGVFYPLGADSTSVQWGRERVIEYLASLFQLTPA